MLLGYSFHTKIYRFVLFFHALLFMCFCSSPDCKFLKSGSSQYSQLHAWAYHGTRVLHAKLWNESMRSSWKTLTLSTTSTAGINVTKCFKSSLGREMTIVATTGVFPLQFLQQKSQDTVAKQASCIMFSSSSIQPQAGIPPKKRIVLFVCPQGSVFPESQGKTAGSIDARGRLKDKRSLHFIPFPSSPLVSSL